MFISGLMRRFLRGAADFVYPRVCAACRTRLEPAAPGAVLCPACRDSIVMSRPPFCHVCGRTRELHGASQAACTFCRGRTFYFDRAFAPCAYEGTLKELIKKFKYGNREYLAGPMAGLLIQCARDRAIPLDTLEAVIPVPLHAVRLRERGYNQSRILAAHVAQAFGKPLIEPLRRRNNTATQTGLTPERRMHNVRGAFIATKPELVREKNVLLIDDVFTTGATVSEAAGALKSAGAQKIFVLTLAH